MLIVLSLLLLSHPSVDSRMCYICNCNYNWATNAGTCLSPAFPSTCVLRDVGNQYCFITSSYTGDVEQRVFEAIARDTFQDSHFIQAVETISLSGTVWLPTTISSISYGCDWDGCNFESLAQDLPESLQMKIDQRVLNNLLIDGQVPTSTCYDCSRCINDLTATLCKSVSCITGICYIDEIHSYIVTPANNCTYNFFSNCRSSTGPPPSPSVRIRATYYIDFPAEKKLEIDEVDILCTKEKCNSIQVVEELKGQIQTLVNITAGFQPNRPNTTTTTTVPSQQSTTTATSVQPTCTERPTTTTTTTLKSASIGLYPIEFLYFASLLLSVLSRH